ncbi:2-oxoglutarate dehydrogenase complex dihydrolipoyllysine-residue succinyltransferase [Salibacteraceae bacterium]|jgi:2-oxoglutarate dehydrogenase E2 component (dihydrolipoamide succinyltransferase)|nr:2-oxoglutarate dehydrogenase complex dihydrolipoyllysine-residue succinyltransferase [Salibacteraceae bacterium]MDA9267513.1 2-oxoglutarate dehydrogenase complex dihydrolipoyllysine-residue succinyltransferase [Salibacteraceae bacterium]MDB4105883.1 2-oxoglutarate dehydrogenase complex dihydrolipoyllysine-residue succinyltransferase [Salibacteraceae bacterium]MDB9708332.1 2-oxoglutarate dehydrogenase complex dihydrolipoyllysine-residue succinyltransferase [Salibacteraceae bacterium]MDC130501
MADIIEMKMPSPGESITEVEVAQLLVQNGDVVELDQPIAEIDSDKATLELNAEAAGKVEFLVEEGDTVLIGQVVCKIDTSVKPEKKAAAPVVAPKEEAKASKSDAPKPQAATSNSDAKATPVAKAMMNDNGVNAGKLKGSGEGGKILKHDVELYLAGGFDTANQLSGWGGVRDERREKMSSLRRKIAERLVSVKNETAMLTTFNEVDMSYVMDLRKKYKEAFKEKHGVNLGFMSFFTKAVTEALRLYPAVNGYIDGQEMVFHDYADIGIAVSSPKGLMVPVLRNAEQMSLAEIEGGIKALALKARDGKLSMDEMTGGTFTITNGGVFGSMLSTPIINPPQSAILGMHNIVERPIAVNGEVKIRPIMYVALSYDHRIIDGKESVSFLYKVKEMIENPSWMLFGGKEPEQVLLGL